MKKNHKLRAEKVEDTSSPKKPRAFIDKQWWKTSGSNTMGQLGKLSKAFLLPIALLPIAGLFIGIGAALTYSGEPAGLALFASLLSKMGSTAFDNLAILFCISAVIAFTNDAGAAALAGLIAFLVFNAVIFTFVNVDTSHYQYIVNFTDAKGHHLQSVYNAPIGEGYIMNPEDGSSASENMKKFLAGNGSAASITVNSYQSATSVVDTYNLLFWHNVSSALFTEILGTNSLNTGVFSGIIVGCIVAFVYNRTYKVQLPTVINFFSGVKLVPIILFVAIIPLSFAFMIVWPPIGKGLTWFGVNSGKLPYGLDSFIFEVFERSLVPFGLHHVFYAPLWWTSAGGGPISGDPALMHALQMQGVDISALNPATLSAVGDQYILYAVLADGAINFKQLADVGMNIGRFQSGKFPFMMFGLTAASVAMLMSVPKENRKSVIGIYLSAGVTCLLTGVTEPIEYTFLFIAPWLFYGVHMPLAAISFWAMGAWKTHVGMTVSGGLLDFIIFGIIPDIGENSKYTYFWHVLAVGPAFSVAYFVLFYFLIKKFDVKIPGRDGAVSIAKLYTKADFKAKKNKKGSTANAKIEKAQIILDALGGRENINSVDACASRLRVNVINLDIVDRDAIKQQGAVAVPNRGSQIQAIFGGEAEIIKIHIREIIKRQEAELKLNVVK